MRVCVQGPDSGFWGLGRGGRYIIVVVVLLVVVVLGVVVVVSIVFYGSLFISKSHIHTTHRDRETERVCVSLSLSLYLSLLSSNRIIFYGVPPKIYNFFPLTMQTRNLRTELGKSQLK